MYIEHANFTVTDLDRSIAFYTDLFGWRVRWRGTTNAGTPAAHVGDDRSYFALFQASLDGHRSSEYERPGFNHLGVVVENLDEMAERLRKLGVTPGEEHDYEPGRRRYFFDPDGNEIELVEYEPADVTTS